MNFTHSATIHKDSSAQILIPRRYFIHHQTYIGEQLQNPNHQNPDSMIPIVKKCPNLVKDKYGEWCCKGTHVCYKTVCNSTLFETVLHLGASIHTITN
jgi:hypothetical protein